MMDTVEITTPSGLKVEIRNYTTRNDDEVSESLLYKGVSADQSTGDGAAGKQTIKFPLANVMASQEAYVARLVCSIDGNSSNVSQRLGELRSTDYKVIEDAVAKIVEENSPKASAAKKN